MNGVFQPCSARLVRRSDSEWQRTTTPLKLLHKLRARVPQPAQIRRLLRLHQAEEAGGNTVVFSSPSMNLEKNSCLKFETVRRFSLNYGNLYPFLIVVSFRSATSSASPSASASDTERRSTTTFPSCESGSSRLRPFELP